MIRVKVIDPSGRTISYVDYRHTMFEALYHPSHIAIVQLQHENHIPTSIPNSNMKIDFFGSSVKAMRVFASTLDLLSRYGKHSEDAPYVGMLFTELRVSPRRIAGARILVVEDGEWGTDDCHGLVRYEIVDDVRIMDVEHSLAREEMRIRALSDPHLDDETRRVWGRLVERRMPPSVATVCQFRMVAPDRWIAKGTLRPVIMEYDFVLPVSCFKGNKLEPGEHVVDILFGVREWARPLRMSVGYQILQWFSPRFLGEIGLDEEIRRVKALHTDRRTILDFVYDDDSGAHSFVEELLLADVYELTLRTKHVQRRIREMTRRAWWHVATHAGLSGVGLMAIPRDLPWMVVNTPHLPAGEFLMARYPIRGWWDIQVVRNLGEIAPYGSIEMSAQTAAHFGGDFDGDVFVLWSGTPSMMEEARSFSGVDIAKEKRRMASDLSYASRASVIQRAIKGARSIGIIANSITTANANRLHHLIPELAEALQSAVDAIKYDTDIDRPLPYCGDPPQWLRFHKERWCFNQRVILSDHDDTISILWNRVASEFTPLDDATIDPSVLVSLVPEPPTNVMTTAKAVMTALYSGPIARAIREIEDEDERDEEIRRICESFRAWASGTPRVGDEKMPGLAENRDLFFRAIWRLSMQNGTNAVFVGFPNETIQLLSHIKPVAARRDGIRIEGGGIVHWAVAKKLIESLPEEQRSIIRERFARGTA